MKKFLMYFFVIVVAFLGGCKTSEIEENNERGDDGIVHLNRDEQEDNVKDHSKVNEQEEALLKKRELIEKEINALETVSLQELNCYADEEASLINSNVLLNYGYVTYDEGGKIYFADMNHGGLYVSDSHGENRKLLNAAGGTWFTDRG